MKRTLKLQLISVDEFNSYFLLDSPGYYLAKEAYATGEALNALETLEALCLANKLYEMELRDRIFEELKPHGKAAEYYEKHGTDAGVDVAIQTLGADRMKQLAREVMAEVRRQSRLGTGENDKSMTP